MGVGTLSANFETVELSYVRSQVADEAGPGARFARQLNTSVLESTGEAEVRQWRLGSRLLTLTEFDALELLWEDCLGGVLPVDWTPPDEASAIEVRILDYQPVASGPARFSVDMTVEEDF